MAGQEARTLPMGRNESDYDWRTEHPRAGRRPPHLCWAEDSCGRMVEKSASSLLEREVWVPWRGLSAWVAGVGRQSWHPVSRAEGAPGPLWLSELEGGVNVGEAASQQSSPRHLRCSPGFLTLTRDRSNVPLS